ncbi:helix-turn-helix domain-containing protein [Muriicola sp. Z0-33]|uniref:helix-turn-helix domain-containing protein n=1 Tax=Muriicola sp. Z0-33 TaxID=2816957 RepID=UPI0022380620|nr:helix-turn-helix domain-containing protein [Muriicola sp. Z0-33]MCW5518116.1 helix-turn-helix domain-containing protein [Muriicola sp. Z0-33]
MQVINIIGISVLLVFIVFILQKRNKRVSDIFLTLTMILFATFLFSDLLIQQRITSLSFILVSLLSAYIFPSFLIYGMVLIEEEHVLRKKWLWFYSFAIIFNVFLLFDVFFLNNYNTSDLENLYENPPFIYHVFYKSSNLFSIIMLLWFLKPLKLYGLKIRNNFSSIENLQLKWLENFSYCFIILNALSILIFLMYNFGYLANVKTPFMVIFSGIVLSLFYFSYHGIRQYALADFSLINEYDKSLNFKSNNGENLNIKYQSSSLSIKEMNSLFAEIKYLFEIEQIYLEPQLKIDEIAKLLEVTTHKISQTINSKANKPFYDYVNEYRINHFKALLANLEKRKFTILALGIESGFNSKASLNRIFKQNTGMSPKEFQKAELS